MKIKRQKFFLPYQRLSIRCIQYNPASEQPLLAKTKQVLADALRFLTVHAGTLFLR